MMMIRHTADSQGLTPLHANKQHFRPLWMKFGKKKFLTENKESYESIIAARHIRLSQYTVI